MKKVLPILLMIMLLAGCSAKEKGEIQELDVGKPIILNDQEELIFAFDASSNENFEVYNDYNAGIAFPYPADWAVTERSPNAISFSGKKGYVLVSHVFTSEAFGEDYKRFLDSFKGIVSNEVIPIGGDSYQRRSRQKLSRVKVVSKDPLLICETYDNIKLSNDVDDILSGIYSEKRYYMHYGNVNTMISVVTEDPSDYEILDYMVANIKTTPIKYDSIIIVNGIALPNTFKSRKVAVNKTSGYSYTPEKNDAFSGCFVQSYSGKIDIEDSNLDRIFLNAFGQNYNNQYNTNGDVIILEDGTSLGVTIDCDQKNGVLNDNMSYIVEIANIGSNTLIVGYPEVKSDLMRLLVED